MSEALNRITEYALNELGCVRISADVMNSNIASKKLLEKCNYTLEGIERKKYLSKSGVFEDACVYSKIK